MSVTKTDERRPVEDMSNEEILAEILTSLRRFEDAIDKLSDSPMARMLPGMGGNGGMLATLSKK